MRNLACRWRFGLGALLALSLALAVVLPVAAADPIVHTVSWGENLHQISVRYGVSVDAIVAANNLASPNHVYIGQRLVIPLPDSVSTVPSGGTHVVQRGENLFRIGLQYGLTTEALARANNINPSATLYTGQVLQVPGVSASVDEPAEQVGTYVVGRGETLTDIAQLHGVSVDALATVNGLYNPSQLYAGQTLTIPGSASVPTAGYTPDQSATTHVVAPGETLFSIARQYGVSQAALLQVNSVANPSLLRVGQSLTIPSITALSSTPGGGAGKLIRVDISDQRTYVYQDGQLLWTFVVSTGIPGSDTWTGTFHVQNKIPNAYASTWALQMPWWLGIYWAGSLQNGFHALPILSNGQRLWAGLLGRPASYGCIILSEEDAQRLYYWAEVGTEVQIAY